MTDDEAGYVADLIRQGIKLQDDLLKEIQRLRSIPTPSDVPGSSSGMALMMKHGPTIAETALSELSGIPEAMESTVYVSAKQMEYWIRSIRRVQELLTPPSNSDGSA